MTSGWDALHAAVAEARALIAAKAPDPEVAAEGEAYVARVMTASMADAFLGHLLTEGGLGRALPTRGGPNPDYVMRHAGVDPSQRYHLEGQLNGSERVGVGLYALVANGALIERGYAVFDASNAGPDGGFSLDIAADAKGRGTLEIAPDARLILIRILHRDPAGVPARMTLSGGAAIPGLTLATGTADGALARSAQAILNSVREYLKWTAATSAHPNQFNTSPPELGDTVQGDPDTHYYLGHYDLSESEWLEVTMPTDLPGYWSLHAYNHWFEGLQTTGAHDRNAVADADGRIRVRIGPAVPADAPNRIDTLSRRRGALICRVIGAKDICPPESRVMRA